MQMQSASYAAPKFAKERGCRTIVLVPDAHETRMGLALSSEPILAPAIVAVRSRNTPVSGLSEHRYSFPLLYEKLMLNALINGHPPIPLATLQGLRKDHPQLLPVIDTIDEADNDDQIRALSEPFLFGRDALSASLNENYTFYNLFTEGGHLNTQAFDSALQYITLLERFIRDMFEQVVSRFESNLIELQELTGAFRVNQEPKRAEEINAPGASGIASNPGQVAASAAGTDTGTANNTNIATDAPEAAETDAPDTRQEKEKKARSKTKRPCVQITKDDTIVADTDIPIYQPESELRQVTAATSNIFGLTSRSLLATRERLQLFHKRRRLNYLAAPYIMEQYTIALVLPDTVTRAELAVWTEVIYKRLQFSGAFITTMMPMASSFSSSATIVLSATGASAKATVSDPNNFTLNNSYAPLPLCGDVIIGTVAETLYTLAQAGQKRSSAVDSAESMANISVLHNFLHLYLLTRENALLYFQSQYAQLLEKILLPDKRLLKSYLHVRNMCSPEEYNQFAGCIVRHMLFSAEQALFSLVRNNCVSYSRLANRGDEEAQQPVITLSQVYPYKFLEKVFANHSQRQQQADDENSSPVELSQLSSISNISCLTVNLGYIGMLIAMSLLDNWLFSTPQPHFPVLCAGRFSEASMEQFYVPDINFSLRAMTHAENPQSMNANRLLVAGPEACMTYLAIPFEILKQDALGLLEKAVDAPASAVGINAILVQRYGTPNAFPTMKSVLFSAFMHLLRLSHAADTVLRKDENKGRTVQQQVQQPQLGTREPLQEEQEGSDGQKEPVPKASAKGKAQAAAASSSSATSKVTTVLQTFRSISVTGMLLYLSHIIEYVGKNFVPAELYAELAEFGIHPSEVVLGSACYDWIDQNFRVGPDRTASLEWLGAAWSTMCDNGIECYVAAEEFQAYGLRVLMERSLFLYP